MDSTVVGGVLALGQAAVLLHAGFGNELSVLVGDTVAALVVGLGIVSGPPVAQVAILVELAPLVVIPVNRLVSDHGTRGRVVDRVILGGIEERWLQNPSREVDGIGLRILIGVHRWRRHSPLGSVERLANLLELAVQLEGRGSLYVQQMIVRANFQGRVVTP